tara:strand:+ start:2396 stop:2689 length:294 start_codon:yes stop_codon:yes gene_type:complete
MRPVLMSDVTAMARALMLVAPAARGALGDRIIRKAQAADRYTRRLKRVHPTWGNGTLRAAAQSERLARETTFDDPAYSGAVRDVFRALARARSQADM